MANPRVAYLETTLVKSVPKEHGQGILLLWRHENAVEIGIWGIKFEVQFPTFTPILGRVKGLGLSLARVSTTQVSRSEKTLCSHPVTGSMGLMRS